MEDFEKELKEGFLQEAEQLLLDAEQCFLSLETLSSDPNGGDRSIIEKIFRLAHSLKGSARAVGFDDIGHFTHELESLLVKVKNGEIRIETSIVSLLLKCNDHLRTMVTTLKADMAARIDSSALISEIQDHMNGTAKAASAPAPEPCEEVPAASAFEPEPAPAGPTTFTSAGQGTVAELFRQATVSPLPLPASVAPPSATPAATPAKAGSAVEEGIRVSLKRLDVLMNNIGELVILQTVLNQHKDQIQSVLLQKTVGQLEKITKDIQGISMSLRMVPLKQTFQKLHRTLRDTSKALGKEITFETSGDETEMDKTVIDNLGDPLVHLIRNAADHGIEAAEERVRAGKPRDGQVKIRASHQGDRVIIEVIDDGKGVNPVIIKAKAIEKGILSRDAEISDRQAAELLFHPGFSTKSEVTDISGRGVGLDVVKTNIEKLQGEVQIESVPGQGTTFRILLPLTLAIIDGMVVTLGEERYVIPVAHIHESLQPTTDDIHHFTGVGEMLSLRGENLPLFRLSSVLNRKVKARTSTDCIAIVVRTGEKPFAILVDDIIGQQQVVIKRLGEELKDIRGFSGSSILGDGRAALILDINELVGRNMTRMSSSNATIGVA
ncbi:MAG: chemotaxis protein CheA [Oligoflexia bacterium]|nr:chemotaxis protein CheA [Oligoflexia bacterium]